MPILADIDWSTAIASAVGAFVTVGGTIGGAVAWLLTHTAKQRTSQREHEAAMLEKQQEHETAIMGRVDSLAENFQSSVKVLTNDSRKESQQTVRVLLDIQRETVEAIGALGGRVSELGHAITSLQHEMGRKADRVEKEDKERRP